MNARGRRSSRASNRRETQTRPVLAVRSRTGASPHQTPDQNRHPRGRWGRGVHRGHGGQGAPGVFGRIEGAQSGLRAHGSKSGDACNHSDDHDDHDNDRPDHDDDPTGRIEPRPSHDHADDRATHHHDDHDPAHDDHDPAGRDVWGDLEIAGSGLSCAGNCIGGSKRQRWPPCRGRKQGRTWNISWRLWATARSSR